MSSEAVPEPGAGASAPPPEPNAIAIDDSTGGVSTTTEAEPALVNGADVAKNEVQKSTDDEAQLSNGPSNGTVLPLIEDSSAPAPPAATAIATTDGPEPEVDPPATAVKQITSGPEHLASSFPNHTLSLSSRAVHADDYINVHRAVAPALHVSTTYRYNSDPDSLVHWENHDPLAPYDSHTYSRATAPNTTRLEALLTAYLGAPSLTYSSGLAAFHALLVFLNPKRIAIGPGYHGCVGVIELVRKLTGLQVVDLTDPKFKTALSKGDLIHVETPVNPTGEAKDLAHYRKIADEVGCYLTVDATFAPPPLQDPFAPGFEADIVMHSGTKYVGGHSDMLCGVLAVRPDRAEKDGWINGLLSERIFLGSVMGSLEGWLGVRSIRTLELRVLRQSESAARLVRWIAEEIGSTTESTSNGHSSQLSSVVAQVMHASVQPEASQEASWLRKQMPRGFGPVFALKMQSEEDARRLPSKLHLFHHATSLGGVESLIEWRAMTDKSVDKKLLRISVGVEAWDDLKVDLEQGFQALAKERQGRKI
jgi:cystathionine gamma-synthase